MDNIETENKVELIVRITSYRGILVINAPETDEGFSHPSWSPGDDVNPRCELRDTKRHLGLSKEAAEILLRLKPEDEPMGDVCWSESDGIATFSWHGYSKCILGAPSAAIGHELRPGQYVEIKNDTDRIAMMIIDSEIGRFASKKDDTSEDVDDVGYGDGE